MKQEFKIIANNIENNTRVLDVGCGDGVLIEYLKQEKNIDVRGLEISKDKVQTCISKGLTVIEGNAEIDLKQFPNNSFDYLPGAAGSGSCRIWACSPASCRRPACPSGC